MIFIGKLSIFFSLRATENHFSLGKLEFFIQLVVKDLTLDVLKDLLSCYRKGYTINSPLRIKVPKLKLLLNSFNSSDPFPNGFNSTFTTDTDNGPKLAASAFTVGDKVAV